VQEGGSLTVRVEVQPSGGYSLTVVLGVENLPQGAEATLSPDRGTPPFTSLLTLAVRRGTPEGSYSLLVTGGDAEGRRHTATLVLRVKALPLFLPSSSVQPLEPYWRSSAPFTVSAVAEDRDGRVVSVALWYRHSPDNLRWGGWREFGVDREEPWSWSFTAPEGEGFYEFCSRATDNDNLAEPLPSLAQASCGLDLYPPPSPILLSPSEGEMVGTRAPVLSWSEVRDLSGVRYEVEVGTDPSLSSPLVRRVVEGTSLVPEGLEEGMYFWRVRAVDGVGRPSPWSAGSFLTLSPTSSALRENLRMGEEVEFLFPSALLVRRVGLVLRENVPRLSLSLLELEGPSVPSLFRWLPPPRGKAYGGAVMGLRPAEEVERMEVELWVREGEVRGRSLRLFALAENGWEEVPLSLRGGREGYLVLTASPSPWPRALALCTTRPSALPPPLSWPPALLLLLVGSLMAVGAAGYFIYAWRFRPILPKVPLASLVRPRVRLPRGAEAMPAVPLSRLEPARPRFEELPEAEPLRVRPVPPGPIPEPEEALRSLLRAGRAPPTLRGLERVIRPVEPAVRPERLAEKIRGVSLPSVEREARGRPEARETLEKLKRLMQREEGSGGGG
jgi:hypothetical protein